jgi:hypothetical protein
MKRLFLLSAFCFLLCESARAQGNLLGAINYDPSSAGTKATSSLLAMTAVDTTNLRIAFTIPAHGYVYVHLHCVVEGATTFPQILLGVMDGANVRGRISPQMTIGATALATTRVSCDADFIVSGLTPGAVSWDAAYGVEIVVAATNIKYGGPNDTTTDNAWGAFSFEVWDPKPAPANWSSTSIDANGRVDVIKVAGTTQTARDLGASVLLSTGTGTGQLDVTSGIVKSNVSQLLGTTVSTPATGGIMDVNVKNIDNDAASASGTVTFPNATLASTTNITAGTMGTVTTLTNLPSIPANWLTATGIAAAALNGKGDWNVGKTGYSLSSAGVDAIWDDATSNNTTSGTFGKLLKDDLDATVSSRSTYAGADTSGTTTLLGRLTSTRAGLLDNLDATISSRSSHSAADVWSVATRALTDKAGFSLSTAGVQAIWDDATSDNTTAGSVGKLLKDDLDATISSRGTSNYSGGDTSGTTTLLSRLTSTRAGLLDHLDADISTRLAASGYTAPPTAAANATAIWTDLLASSDFSTSLSVGKLLKDDIDAAISSRGTSTYAGADTSGTTTLLSRLTSTRAGLLDHLDADISSRGTSNYSGGDTSGVTTLLSRIGSALTITSGKIDINDKTGFSLISAYDPAKVDLWNVTLPSTYTGQKAGRLLWKVGNKP